MSILNDNRRLPVVFISILGLRKLSICNMCTNSFSHLALQYCSINLTLFHRGWWPPFSLHTCLLSMSLFRQQLSPPLQLISLNSLPQLHRIGDLIQERYLKRVKQLLNSVLMLYKPQIFWITESGHLHPLTGGYNRWNIKYNCQAEHFTLNSKEYNNSSSENCRLWKKTYPFWVHLILMVSLYEV